MKNRIEYVPRSLLDGLENEIRQNMVTAAFWKPIKRDYPVSYAVAPMNDEYGGCRKGDYIIVSLQNPFRKRGFILFNLGRFYVWWMNNLVYPYHPEMRDRYRIASVESKTQVSIIKERQGLI